MYKHPSQVWVQVGELLPMKNPLCVILDGLQKKGGVFAWVYAQRGDGRGVRMVECEFPKLKAGGSSPFSLDKFHTFLLYMSSLHHACRSIKGPTLITAYTRRPYGPQRLMPKSVGKGLKKLQFDSLNPYKCMGIGGIERPTSRLSGVRSNH